jgi:hypothetical protein
VTSAADRAGLFVELRPSTFGLSARDGSPNR